jgi:hypothetical protein
MRHVRFRLIISILVVLLAGCATVKDVQRASDIIRSDNDLARIVQEVRPFDKISAKTELTQLAFHAKSEADAIKAQKGKFLDAIAYYRIAATAFWKSGNPQVANQLFEVTDTGSGLCTQLGDKAPDRDCLFLRLVIPFAGLEAEANEKGLSKLLAGVNFGDAAGTDEEIKTMKQIQTSLSHAQSLVQKIFEIEADERLVTHPGMVQYYCENAWEAAGFYLAVAAVFETKVLEYQANIGDDQLSITADDAKKLRNLVPEKPINITCKTK